MLPGRRFPRWEPTISRASLWMAHFSVWWEISLHDEWWRPKRREKRMRKGWRKNWEPASSMEEKETARGGTTINDKYLGKFDERRSLAPSHGSPEPSVGGFLCLISNFVFHWSVRSVCFGLSVWRSIIFWPPMCWNKCTRNKFFNTHWSKAFIKIYSYWSFINYIGWQKNQQVWQSCLRIVFYVLNAILFKCCLEIPFVRNSTCVWWTDRPSDQPIDWPRDEHTLL